MSGVTTITTDPFPVDPEAFDRCLGCDQHQDDVGVQRETVAGFYCPECWDRHQEDIESARADAEYDHRMSQ